MGMLRNDQRHVGGASLDTTGLHPWSQKIRSLPWGASSSGNTGAIMGHIHWPPRYVLFWSLGPRAVGTVAAALAQVSYQGLVMGSFSSLRKTWNNLVVSLSLCICVGLGEGLLIWHLDVRL